MKLGNLTIAILLTAGTFTAQAAPPKQAACADCGTVTDVRMTERDGKGGATGMIAGGIAGGLLGNQIGSGNGRTVATVAGAAGGAYAGKQVEGKMNKLREWHVTVRFESGLTDTVLFSTDPALHNGDRVRRRDGTLVRS